MLVRCGRCKAELEITGAGEFLCPRCGTRNVVRSQAPDPYALSSLTQRSTAAAPEEPNAAIRWLVCPECSYRFAAGVAVTQLSCPNCRASLPVADPDAQAGAAS